MILVLVLGCLTQNSTGLKRHGRHRRVSGPDPAVVNSNERRIKAEQLENKFKPNFKRCDDYLPEVDEQSPAGKFFISFFYIQQIDKNSKEQGETKYVIACSF